MIMAEGIMLNGLGAAGGAYETFQLRGPKPPKYPGMTSRTGVVMSHGLWDDWAASLQPFERAV